MFVGIIAVGQQKSGGGEGTVEKVVGRCTETSGNASFPTHAGGVSKFPGGKINEAVMSCPIKEFDELRRVFFW